MVTISESIETLQKLHSSIRTTDAKVLEALGDPRITANQVMVLQQNLLRVRQGYRELHALVVELCNHPKMMHRTNYMTESILLRLKI